MATKNSSHGREKQRFKLLLEYDGSRFSGWQQQKEAVTVQGTLRRAAASLFAGSGVDVQGNGRTDAGVHALRYAAHLEAVTDLSAEAIRDGLNELLPKDIVVLAVEPSDPRFHARHSCVGRSYLYRIAKRKSAFGKRYVWWVQEPLDVVAMARAALQLEGMLDFAAFAEKKELKKSTRVLVRMVQVTETEDFVLCRVVASHFLWHMVRRLVGVLVEVGAGRLDADGIPALLAGPPASLAARYTAPAAGLFFERAFYDEKALARFLVDCRQGDEGDWRPLYSLV